MTSAAFLIFALIVTIGGTTVLWVRSRGVHTIDAGVDEFRREMNALAPENSNVLGARSGVTARTAVTIPPDRSRFEHPTSRRPEPEGWLDSDDGGRV